MKICLLLEGSYPHVTGGVSTWAQLLIKGSPEHEFMIYSVGAHEKYRGKYRYDLPKNIISIKEIFLDEMLGGKGRYGKKYRIPDDTRENLKRLITGEKIDWAPLLGHMARKRIKNEMDFFMSITFFEILKEAYLEKYASVPFTDFFWTVRSMLIPLFFLLKQDIPLADIYHSASNGYAGILGAFAKSIYKRPFLLTEHGIYSREREEEIIKSRWARDHFKDMWIGFFYNICRGVYEYSDKVLTLFEKNKKIEVDLGCKEEKIDIIPNGIDLETLKDLAEKDERSVINIGSFTRIAQIKDIKTMLQSFKIVKNEVPSSKFFIMGPTDEDEQYYKECRELAARLDIKDLVFTGKIDIKQYLGKMDICVLTSISEGQPFAILEAFAAKKPFVSTDVGGCSELIYGNGDGHGKGGIVVPVMNIEKIAQAVIKLSKDPLLRKSMGENGYSRAMALYTFDKCLKSYKKVYKEYEV